MRSYYFRGESALGDEPSSPEELDAEKDVYVPEFSVIEESLKFYGIHIKERTSEYTDIENTLDDPKIKSILYATLVQELRTGNTDLLEFVLAKNLLTKSELEKYGIASQKNAALLVLKNMRGQQRARDIDSFLESGIFTRAEALELKFSNDKN